MGSAVGPGRFSEGLVPRSQALTGSFISAGRHAGGRTDPGKVDPDAEQRTEAEAEDGPSGDWQVSHEQSH